MSEHQITMVSLDELVSPDHQYRKFKSLFNFKAVERELLAIETEANYKGYGALRLFKCSLLQFMEDLSDRELERYLADSNAGKWFCDFALTETTPDYSVFSKIRIIRILTDRGGEYKGNIEHHAFELFLSIEGIEHTTTKAYSPQPNGMCERFNKTMKQEFFDTAMRKKIYNDLDDLQLDLDIWLEHYNNERPHSGKYCYGKTPMQTFMDSKKLAVEKNNEILYLEYSSDRHNLSDIQI